ncbi:hypothetical protein [Ruminococcus albus]|uniref:hypothetical protein n=1 Tax=Ruminococcus albus TaxID=1264 RepID=UPI0004666E56|nr:hypothetical protein [Ruminococcus albus]
MTEMDIIELSLYIGFISLCMIVYFSPSIINYLKKKHHEKLSKQNQETYQKEVKRIAKEYESSQFLADIYSEIKSASISFGFNDDMPIKSVRIHHDHLEVSFYNENVEKYYNKEIMFKNLGYKELKSSDPKIMDLKIGRNPEEDGFGEALQVKLGDQYYYVADWDDHLLQARYYIKTKREFISPESKLKPTR